MITIKKYYWDYNAEDDSYYVDKSYPQYGNNNDHKKNKEHEKICFNINIHNNLANQGGNTGQNANQEGQISSRGEKNKLKEFNLEEEVEDE